MDRSSMDSLPWERQAATANALSKGVCLCMLKVPISQSSKATIKRQELKNNALIAITLN